MNKLFYLIKMIIYFIGVSLFITRDFIMGYFISLKRAFRFYPKMIFWDFNQFFSTNEKIRDEYSIKRNILVNDIKGKYSDGESEPSFYMGGRNSKESKRWF